MARYGCLALAVIVATALLFFIVYLWSGWLNRPTGHSAGETAVTGAALLRTHFAQPVIVRVQND